MVESQDHEESCPILILPDAHLRADVLLSLLLLILRKVADKQSMTLRIEQVLFRLALRGF
jgi:hypothetical protein